ncbi:MAG: RNA polymerase sigma factor [Bryobacteraceae bacterium]
MRILYLKMSAATTVARPVVNIADRTIDFEAVIRGHQSMVFSLAVHFLRDRAVAEDLAQEVFLELYRNMDSIQSHQHMVYWLRKVTSRRCIDQARRTKVRAHVSFEEAAEPFIWTQGEDPALKRYVEQLLGKLGETARMIVILRYQEGLDPMEIAGMLDMPLATVKSHLQRSLASMRKRVGEATGEAIDDNQQDSQHGH